MSSLGFPGDSDGKESTCNAGDPGSIPGRRNGNPLHYSCLENPMDGGAWLVTVCGGRRARHDRVTSLSLVLSKTIQEIMSLKFYFTF